MIHFRTQNNQQLRQMMAQHGIHVWELADAIGVSENTLYRWLRHDLEGNALDKVTAALDSMIAER